MDYVIRQQEPSASGTWIVIAEYTQLIDANRNMQDFVDSGVLNTDLKVSIKNEDDSFTDV